MKSSYFFTFSLVLLKNCIISLLLWGICLTKFCDTSKHTHKHARAHAHITQSFYTLTINLQPVAQLDCVAMANILPPESSAEMGAREAQRERESHFEHVMKVQEMGESRRDRKSEEKIERGREVIKCILIGVT